MCWHQATRFITLVQYARACTAGSSGRRLRFVVTMFDAARACGFASVSKDSQFHCSMGQMNRSSPGASYEDAVHALNGLQSNAVTIQKAVNRQVSNLEDTVRYLRRTGLALEDLDRLAVIHVAGTKGKGSTCALTESILRSFGVKTGFFSSPHLLSVTERFRIDGEPISREDFTRNFWKVYNALMQQKDHDEDMPPYFKFLTIVCFHVFLEKKVDVAILEVGIGGENDCTNVVRNTKTVGITSLGLDHTWLLGNTLEQIAWQKAGIIKPNSNVFTSPQPEVCMRVIKERVKEKNAKLFIAPDFSQYKWKFPPKLQMTNKIQTLNATLAIQLAYDWLKRHKLAQLNGFVEKLNIEGITLEVCNRTITGLEQCFWPGRGQIIHFYKQRFYLDGAHTKESLELAFEWFLEQTNQSQHAKCLIFNAAGDRDSKQLVRIVSSYRKQFKTALFVPNIPFDAGHKCADNNSIWGHQQQKQKAQEHCELWISLNEGGHAMHFGCILDALRFLQSEFNGECDVLVTGSLHLIGASLQALEEYDKEVAVKMY